MLYDMRGCLDDDYLDNETAMDEFYDICIDAAMNNNNEMWYRELLEASSINDSAVNACPRCGCKGSRICYIHNGSIQQLICPDCGFTVKNAICDRDIFEYCLSHWKGDNAVLGKKEKKYE